MNNLNFEQSFEKLEKLLNEMNSSELSLDRSLACYEEADTLIQNCQKQLQKAEKKIETLVKNRNQELALDENNEPVKQPFDESQA